MADIDSSLSKSVRKKILCEDIERIIVDAVHMQVDKDTLLEWFDNTAEKFKFIGRKG